MLNPLARELHRSKYRLLGLVGQGQFGRVYCASRRKTGRLVALKELDRDRFSTHKFLRELRFLLSLQHENIVTCHSMEQTATGRYLVMDYCEGGTLRNLLDEDVQLHPIQGLRLITQILAGLAHAHQRGIVHCDIKPENILLTVTVEGWTAKISDFGIARLSQEMASDEFSNTGSPAYMAPERFYGQHSIASDLYAVGVLLFEMLVGHRPFSGVPAELMSAHLNKAVQIPASVPAELQAIISKALQKLPARRFRSAQEMLTALQAAIPVVEPEISQDWKASTLLSSYPSSPPVRFSYNYHEMLDTPIQQLASSRAQNYSQSAPQCLFQEEQFFRVYGNRVGCQTYSEAANAASSAPPLLLHPPSSMTRVRLPDPISQLMVQPQGCFAVTQQQVYWLTAELFNSPSQQFSTSSTKNGETYVSPQLVAEFDRPMHVAIAPNGDWMATANSSVEALTSQLHIWNLRNLQPFKPSITVQAPPAFQLLPVDSRHLASLSHCTDPGAHASIVGVQIDFLTRRGTAIGSLKLPIPLRQITLTSTPYRWLATEPHYPTALLFLDIKPLRIQRIGLDIIPHLIATTTWGFAVISQDGQMVLLDKYGQLVGRLEGPASPTAIAFLSPHYLAIASWQETHGYLYGVNLRDLELDLLF